jgi:hypothetical protein
MQERILTIYCLGDEFVKASGVVEHPCTTMSTAEGIVNLMDHGLT